MTGYVVYYDEEHIYMSGKIEDMPLFIPFDIEEKIFSTEAEMMAFIEELENR